MPWIRIQEYRMKGHNNKEEAKQANEKVSKGWD